LEGTRKKSSHAAGNFKGVTLSKDSVKPFSEGLQCQIVTVKKASFFLLKTLFDDDAIALNHHKINGCGNR
jgi:hypothetical protein